MEGGTERMTWHRDANEMRVRSPKRQRESTTLPSLSLELAHMVSAHGGLSWLT